MCVVSEEGGVCVCVVSEEGGVCVWVTHCLTWLQTGGGSLHETGPSPITTGPSSSSPTAIRREEELDRGCRRAERTWDEMGRGEGRQEKCTEWSALSMCST